MEHGGPIDAASAIRLIKDSDFLWHQRWELAPGIFTPGPNDVGFLYDKAGLESSFAGLSVLDIGTTNGGGAFEAERRGASRVVAVDIVDSHHFGFSTLARFLRSKVEFRQANVYELPEALGGETFDLVLFWGVLYHLRHPVLALDCVRAVAHGRVMVESAVCDHELDEAARAQPLARFYRRDELGGDSSNWFAPTQRLLTDWCESSGLKVERSSAWPEPHASRSHAACVVHPGLPEAHRLSFEGALQATVVYPRPRKPPA